MEHPGSAPPRLPVAAAPIRSGNPHALSEGEPGRAAEAPSLAVQYADGTQDEAELQRNIGELLATGTPTAPRWVWVVRLHGLRQVEVYAAPWPRPVRVMGPGEVLEAPGILESPVPVEALYECEAAHDATLRHLLQRKGYESLDAIREEGRADGLRSAVRDLCELLGIALPAAREAVLHTMGVLDLSVLRQRIKRDLRWP